jgi:DNA-binding NtrC family response regulator
VLATLEACSGNKSKTAAVLGISLKTLYTRLHEYAAGARSSETRGDAPAPAAQGERP